MEEMKLWIIWTHGGGTPMYLVGAETRERAWELICNAWREKYHNSVVGSDYYGRGKGNTVEDLKEVNTVPAHVYREFVVDLFKLA